MNLRYLDAHLDATEPFLQIFTFHFSDPNDPKNVTALAEADADDSGFYVIAGSSLVGCYFRKQYALRLYADKLTTFPLEVDKYGKNDRIDVPEEYVLREDQPVKIFEKDIEARIIIVP